MIDPIVKLLPELKSVSRRIFHFLEIPESTDDFSTKSDGSCSISKAYFGTTHPIRGLPARWRATGRDLSIQYAGTSPSYVSDSWGNVGWVLTTSNHRIDTIAIENTSYAWQYVYTGNLLTSVVGPGGATWRTYVYTSGRLTAVKDAAGKTLESHSYDFDGE